MEWRHFYSPKPNETNPISNEITVTVFWETDSMLLIDFMEPEIESLTTKLTTISS